MTYDELVQRCRRTLDLSPDSKEGLRDIEKIVARYARSASMAASLYSCLFRNLLEYVEQKQYEDLEHEHLGCPVAKTGIYAGRLTDTLERK